jgi:hypothetical protein
MNILEQKGKFCIQQIRDGKREEHPQLHYFIDVASSFLSSHHPLCYDDILDVWENSGPVAAKIYSWTQKQTSNIDDGNGFVSYRNTTLHLPGCNQIMTISCGHFDSGFDPEYDDDQLMFIRVKCGQDMDVKTNNFPDVSAHGYRQWAWSDTRAALEDIRPAINLLQDELGQTEYPIIDTDFFIWLSFFSFTEEYYKHDGRLKFTNSVNNDKPTPESVQPALERYHQNQPEEYVNKEVVSKWKQQLYQDKINPIERIKTLVDLVVCLIQRSEMKAVEKLIKYYELHRSHFSRLEFIDYLYRSLRELIQRN